MSNTTLLGLYNPFSNPNAYPKRKETRFGYALGLEKGLYNPNRVVFETDSKLKKLYFQQKSANKRIRRIPWFRYLMKNTPMVQLSDIDSKLIDN